MVGDPLGGVIRYPGKHFTLDPAATMGKRELPSWGIPGASLELYRLSDEVLLGK